MALPAAATSHEGHNVASQMGNPVEVASPVRDRSTDTSPIKGFASSSRQIKKRRGNLPKDAVGLMKRWLVEHTSNAYPTEEEKLQFAAMTGLTTTQVRHTVT